MGIPQTAISFSHADGSTSGLTHPRRVHNRFFGIWMSDGNQLPPAGETTCPT